MTTAGCRLFDQAGLTWRKLAASATVAERDVMRWRGEGQLPLGPVHRAIVTLARELPGGEHDGKGR